MPWQATCTKPFQTHLTVGQVYEVVEYGKWFDNPQNESGDDWVKVVDNDNEEYIYPVNYFENIIEIPEIPE